MASADFTGLQGFLKLEGVAGEVTAQGFERDIEIYEFSWTAANSAKVGSGSTGLSAGAVSISSFTFLKSPEMASPQLFGACCSGRLFGSAIVHLCKPDRDRLDVVVRYAFENVMVSEIVWSGGFSDDDDRLTESVSLAFGKVVVEYIDSTQSRIRPIIASWDLTKMSK